MAYSASVAATGGTPPYAWSITSGTLPPGLSFASATGAISGTPSAVADHTPLTLQVADAGGLTASKSAVLNISPKTLSVSLSPNRSSLTTTQQISLTATTNDVAGVSWSITPSSGPAFDSTTSLSGANVTLTAPTTAGVYTVTATSVTDGTTAAATTVAVTDLAGVYTYHNDLARGGANVQEYALTPANVNTSSFGKLFSCTVDGAIHAQPLWAANLTIGGTKHNVVFVATQHDSVFAFDADHNPCELLWTASLIDSAHGASAGESTVPSAGPDSLVGSGYGNITPETGITGTPVIDPTSGILYVVSKSVDSSRTSFYQRLHAIDLVTGAEKNGSPVTITASYPGTGDGGTTVTFDARQELQRPGLALVNSTVFVAWASHEDTAPYYGWIIGYSYDGKSLTQTQVLNIDPNAGLGGIWMSGGAPAADDAGNLYLLTGNGVFDADNLGPLANNDYGDSLLQLSSTDLSVSHYFTPSDQALGLTQDTDFGAGAAILVNLPAGSPINHIIVGGGKDGILRVLNGDALGGYGDENALQQLSLNHGLYSTPAFWHNRLFVSGAGVQVFELDPSTALFSAISASPLITIAGSMSAAVSASGDSNGIVWTLESTGNCVVSTVSNSYQGGQVILQAFDASNVGNELWNSTLSADDTAGNAVSLTVPTVANGKVYIGTRGKGDAACSLTSTTGELDVYGLK